MKTLKKYVLRIAAFLVLALPVSWATVPTMAATSGGSASTGGGTTSTSVTQSDPNCNNSSDAGINKCLKNNQIVKDLNDIVDFLSAGVGIVVIATIIVGGIQYSLAGDNATATGAAKQRITNGLIALATFIFAFALLQWLIPGGL
jgi:hypothetical protein